LRLNPPNNRTYDDDFNTVPRNRGSGSGLDSTNPSRSQGSGANPDDFSRPRPSGTNQDTEPFEPNDPSGSSTRETFRPAGDANLGAPNSGETVIPSKKPAPPPPIENGAEDKKGDKTNQSLRLDTRVTSRAVSPRERHSTLGNRTNAVAGTPARRQVDTPPRTVNVARY
jgi:hypothetical protein